jgi:hypothetical protein
MASRVEQDAPLAGGGLERRGDGPQSLGLGYGRIQVADREIQVDRLGDSRFGPRRRLIVRDRDGGDLCPVGADAHRSGAGEHDLAAQDRGPELSEWSRVGTVHRHAPASSDSHATSLEG